MKQNYTTGFTPSRTATGHRTAMGRLLLMTLLLFAFVGGAKAQTTVTIGEGTATSNTNPIGTYYNYSITEQLYTADEIGMAGTISSISFYFMGLAEKDLPITVYMKHVDEADLASAGITLADAEEVFTGTLSVPAEAGWVTIDLNTPFAYDGTSNLLIGVIKDYLYYFSGQSWQGTATSSTMARYTQNDNNSYDTSTVPGTAQANRPNIQIEITSSGGPTCEKPATLEVTDITGYDATCTWASEVGNYTFEYKKASDSDWTMVTGLTSTTYTLSNLEPFTTYNVRVKAVCGAGSESGYKTVNFTTLDVCPDGIICIGEGTTTNNVLPTNTYYKNSLTQQIYTVQELGEAGVISSVTFYCTQNNTKARNFDIYMVSTEKESFENTTDWIAVTSTDLVYRGSVTLTQGWNTFVLDNPFTYNGNSNVALIIDANAAEYENKINFFVYNADGNQTIQAYNDNTDYDPTNPSSYTGTLLGVKNRIRLSMDELPACPKPTGLKVNYTGGTEATVSWTSDASAWNMKVNGTLVEGTITNPYTLTNLELGTTYSVEVQAVCSDTEQSEWTNPVSFTTDACMPEDMIIVNYTLNDSYGDGWGNNYILVVNEDCNLADYVTLDNGSTGTGTIKICGSYAQFLWYAGDYPGETSWTFTDTDGNVLFSGTGSSDMATYDVLYTIDKNPYPRPTDLAVANVGPFSAELSWTENGSATEWEIGFVNSEGNIVSSVTADSNPFTLTDLNAETTYTLQLRSISNKGMSLWTCDNITFTTASVAGAKPYDLSVTPYPAKADVSWNGFTENYNLEWTVAPTIVPTPASSSESSLWLQYDIDNYVTNIGGSTSNEQTWGTMYPARMFEGNNNLSKVAIMETSYYTMDSYTVNIYSGGETAPGTLVGTQTVAPAGSNGMHVITLDSPITIDPMQNLWITVTATGTYIKAACSGTESNNQWTLNNGSWVCVADLNSSLAGYGWMIRGYVEGYNPDAYEWNTVTGITSPYTIESLQPETTYIVKVQSDFDTAGLSKWTWNIFTTPSVTDDPIELAATDIKATKATLSWTGYQDSYNVQYRTATKYDAVWEDDFENGLDNWTIGHADNATAPANGYWYTIDPTNGLDFVSHGGTNCASSWSWNNSAYQADNWLITPQLELQGILKFYVRTNSTYPDSYEVLLSTTGNAVTYTYDESDTNHENPIFTGDFTTTLQAMAPAPNNGEWNEVVIDLSAYNGQLGYIAIHHQDYDMNYLLIDDFGIYNRFDAGEWIFATTTEPTLAISGLTPETEYEWQVQGLYEGGTTEWVSSSFTTEELVEIELVNDDSKNEEDKKNSDFIDDAAGKYCNVLLSDRTLYKDGEWNTICLPFDVEIEESPLAGATAKTLTDATMTGTHVTLTFGDAVTTLEAGTPYIIKWDASAENIVDPTFTDVLVKDVAEADRTIEKADGHVKFIGYYDAFGIDTPNDDDIYYMTAGNMLKHTGVDRILKACRAYFQFSENVISTVREFVLDFGDGTSATGITEVSAETMGNGDWYTIDGVKRNAEPTRKGLYIQNGKKVVIR